MQGTGNIVNINGENDKDTSIQILEENICQSAQNFKLCPSWIFQQDNDPKHTAKIVKKWFSDRSINLLS